MIYRRSGTAMDKAGYFFPPRRQLSGMNGFFDDLFGNSDWSGGGDILAGEPPTNGSGGFSIGSAVDAIKDLYIAGKTLDAQQKLLEENARRAAQGLPALSAQSLQPQARVNVGVDPMLMKVGVGVAIGLGALMILRPGRR